MPPPSLSYRCRPPGATHPFRFSYRLLIVGLLACFLSLSDAFVPTTPCPVGLRSKASSRSAGTSSNAGRRVVLKTGA